jgi:hypothetical protein
MRSLMFMALLAAPGVALGQSKPFAVQLQVDDDKPAASKGSDTDRKLAQLEERLQAMIKEIQALRAGNNGIKGTVLSDKAGETQTRRVVVQGVPGIKSTEKTEIRDVVRLALENKSEGEKSIAKTIILQAQPSIKGSGTIELKFDDAQIQKLLQPEKTEKHAAETKNRQFDARMLLMTEDGKSVSPGTIEIHGIEAKPGEQPHGAGVASPKPAEKKMVVRALPSTEGKWVIEMMEAKPGEQPKMVIVGDDKDAGRSTKVVREVQSYIVDATGVAKQASGDSNVVNLTRATYHLNQARAHALESFLKENAKARVLETKVEGDNLVVTTTPDVQRTIGQVVNLMSDDSARTTFQLHLSGAPQLQYKLEAPPKPTPKKVDREDD